MRRLLLIFLFLPFAAAAQTILPHTISTGQLPGDSDQVAAVTPYIDTTGEFVQSGFEAGDLVPDFILFDTASQPLHLGWLLSEGKPVLLASVSLTCPASRRSMTNALHDIYASYGNALNYVLVYTIEAHPCGPDFSPYSDTVDVPAVNYTDSAVFSQPLNYYQRRQMAGIFIDRFHPAAHVVIDGPGNEYWQTFGPAPNNAYLLTPQGVVFRKYGWMAQSEAELLQDVPLLLNTLGTEENTATGTVSVFPNPSGEQARIHVETPGSWTLSIFDLSGKTVATLADIRTQDAELEPFQLAAGSYFLVVRTAERSVVLRYVRR